MITAFREVLSVLKEYHKGKTSIHRLKQCKKSVTIRKFGQFDKFHKLTTQEIFLYESSCISREKKTE